MRNLKQEHAIIINMQIVTTRIIQETPHRYTNWKSRDKEMRELRLEASRKDRFWKVQKDKNGRLEKEVKQLKQKLREKGERESELEQELEKLRKERDCLKDMLFKKNSHAKEVDSDGKVHFIEKRRKRKRGGQPGHKGKGYQKLEKIDESERIYLSHCPDCKTELKRSDSIYTHTDLKILLKILLYCAKLFSI